MPELEPIFFLYAFLAGFLTFLAPCTLPLLPAYLGFISGVTEKEIQTPETRKMARKNILKNSLMFVSGFSIVLILTGMSAGFLGGLLSSTVSDFLVGAGGVLIIIFGLFMMGVVKFSFLTRERRIKVPQWLTIGNPKSAFLLGSAFAIGWTPCIGPVYGTILIYASSTQTVLAGFSLLAVFSAGFSIPLLILAVLISQATKLVEKVLPYIHAISFLGGIALVIVGLSLLLGNTALTNWFFYLFEYVDLGDVLLPYL